MTTVQGHNDESIREKTNIALTSIAAALFLTGIKLFVGIQTNSLGILSEAAHSGLDLIAALLTYFAVTIAERPADEEHQYGHGKIENVSALLQTILLLVTCAWIIWEAIRRLVSHETHIEATVWSFSVMVVAIVIDVSRSRALKRIAKKHRSQALEADALHFSSDIWSSLVVIVGLGFVSNGYTTVDAIAAIGVALLVLFISYRLGRKTIDALMDRVPEGLYQRMLTTIREVEGVEEVHSIRLRPSGAKVFVDTIVGIRRTTPFEHAHAIMDKIEMAIQAADPNVDVRVHAEPFEGKDETVADKIRMMVIKNGLRAPHNLEVHHTDGKYHIDFDLEYQQGKSFTEAHQVATEIEEQIRRTVPSVEKVTIHMEEYQPTEVELGVVTEAEAALREKIRGKVMQDKRILGCSDVTLLKAGDKYTASVTCQIEKKRPLDEVHKIISETEMELYKKFKELRRVTIHAEPG